VIEFLTGADVTILSDRRRTAPYGLDGGRPGRPGVNTHIRKGKARRVGAKGSFRAEVGDVLRIETPGGGGFGAA
jgi:N-methylhydantoinase B/oxoprolinase/acetone carboxylase alpha subunit